MIKDLENSDDEKDDEENESDHKFLNLESSKHFKKSKEKSN